MYAPRVGFSRARRVGGRKWVGRECGRKKACGGDSVKTKCLWRLDWKEHEGAHERFVGGGYTMKLYTKDAGAIDNEGNRIPESYRSDSMYMDFILCVDLFYAFNSSIQIRS